MALQRLLQWVCAIGHLQIVLISRALLQMNKRIGTVAIRIVRPPGNGCLHRGFWLTQHYRFVHDLMRRNFWAASSNSAVSDFLTAPTDLGSAARQVAVLIFSQSRVGPER